MGTFSLLYSRVIPVNDKIGIYVPSVGEVLQDEDSYYQLVTTLTAMPIDMMVPLDDLGIDFTKIDEYELFLLCFSSLKTMDTSLVFGDLNLGRFQPAINNENGNVVLRNDIDDITIDRAIYAKIAGIIRKIHYFEKNERRPGNEAAKDYMIERARKKLRRSANRNKDSQLEELIIALVNTEQFSYGYDDVLDLTIYQLNASARQIVKKIDYDNRMIGIYAGTVNAKELSQSDLNWLTHK